MTRRLFAAAVALTLALTGCSFFGSARDSNDKITQATQLEWKNVQAGDCVPDMPEKDSYEKLPVVPCDQPHKAQVFKITTLEGSLPPSDDDVQAKVALDCIPAFKTFFGGSYYAAEEYKITYFSPDSAMWMSGDHSIQCLAKKKDGGDITGDLAGTMTALPNVVAVPEVGQCIGDPNDTTYSRGYLVIDCTAPHYYEAYATQAVTTAPASDSDSEKAADDFCVAQFATFIGIPFNDSTLSYRPFYPTTTSWAQGDKSMTCLVGSDQGGITGSLAGSQK